MLGQAHVGDVGHTYDTSSYTVSHHHTVSHHQTHVGDVGHTYDTSSYTVSHHHTVSHHQTHVGNVGQKNYDIQLEGLGIGISCSGISVWVAGFSLELALRASGRLARDARLPGLH